MLLTAILLLVIVDRACLCCCFYLFLSTSCRHLPCPPSTTATARYIEYVYIARRIEASHEREVYRHYRSAPSTSTVTITLYYYILLLNTATSSYCLLLLLLLPLPLRHACAGCFMGTGSRRLAL